MSINQIRTILYFIARILGDINAVQKGKIGQRIGRRILGKIFGRMMGRIFK
ncbi:MAG: hypothetical protein WHV63_11945 [Ignavibacteria bacterium]|jgi:hypothetical protein|nr:hypothetical protein [Ignavibacteria bacterium]MDH7528349.1 hypothetical protein [Ignavibacteria bacterium]NPV12487.1 hypothetical protein [Ignavibacteria bacterium]